MVGDGGGLTSRNTNYWYFSSCAETFHLCCTTKANRPWSSDGLFFQL